MKIGSLCSGAGGLDMAVEQAFGAETVWHCEINDAASKVLEYRYPGVPNHRDLINTDWTQVEPIDILAAGWPCQPFSAAGKKLGAEDERAIWPYVARAIRVLRPRIVVLENVSAVLGPEFQRVANSLAEIGYDIRWTCLRASDVGAPHRRERLFVVATDARRDGFIRSSQRNVGPEQPGLSASQRGDLDRRHVEAGWPRVELLPTPCAQQSGNTPENHLAKKPGRKVVTDLAILVENGLIASGGALLPTPAASDGTGGGQHPDKRVGHSRQLIDYVLLQTPSVADALGGHLTRSGARGDEPLLPGQAREMDTGWGKYAAAIARWEAVTRPAPSPTEPNRNGKPRLNPAFSEWMMGWPAGWVTDVPGISRNDQLRIIGNGVVPQCASAALSWLLELEPVVGGLSVTTQEPQR